MNTRTLTFILITHLLVGLTCFRLGSDSSPSSSPQALQAAPSSIITTDPQQNKQDSFPAPSTQVSPSSMSQAMAGQGYRSRIESELAKIGSMELDEILTALKDLRQQPGNPDTVIIEQMLLARFTEIDPEHAIRYAVTLKEEMSVLTVMNSWTSSDPKAAAAYLSENFENFSVEEQAAQVAAGSIAAEWARQDPDAAMTWAKSLPEEAQGEAYGRIMAQLASEDPASATAAYETMSAGPERSTALTALVDQWTSQDPQATAEWVTDQPFGVEQRVAVASMMRTWMAEAPLEASTWLGNQEAGPAKDSAIIGMTQTNLLANDPEANAVWSASIQDTTLRDRAVQIAVSRWSATDPSAAQAWLLSQPAR